jgi:hypothetical protein
MGPRLRGDDSLKISLRVVKIAQTLLKRRWKLSFGGGRYEEGTDLRMRRPLMPQGAETRSRRRLMLKTRRALIPPILV